MRGQEKLTGNKSWQNILPTPSTLKCWDSTFLGPKFPKTNHTSLVGSAWSPGQCTISWCPLNSNVRCVELSCSHVFLAGTLEAGDGLSVLAPPEKEWWGP